MSSDPIDHLYVRLADRLRRQFALSGLRIGDRLPPMRTLVRETHSSMPVVRKALAVLRREGLIESHQGQGTYLRRLAPVNRAGLRRILMLGVDITREHEPSGTLLQEIARQAAMDQIEVLFEIAQSGDDGAMVAQRVAEVDPDAVILTGQVERQVAERVHRTGRRVVLSGDTLDGGAVPNLCEVRSCDRFAGYLAMQHLIALGHHRVGMLIIDDDRWWQQERIAGFRQAVEDAGLSWDGVPVAVASRDLPSMRRAAKELLSLPSPIGAIACTGYWLADEVIEVAQRLGIAIPRDCSLIAIDGLPQEVHQVTSVRCGLRDWAAGLLRLVREQLADQPARVLTIPRILTLRGTTAARGSGRIATFPSEETG